MTRNNAANRQKALVDFSAVLEQELDDIASLRDPNERHRPALPDLTNSDKQESPRPQHRTIGVTRHVSVCRGGDEIGSLVAVKKVSVSTPAKRRETIYNRAHGMNLAGLALSGGGIRSAVFNLGAIQSLSRFGLLSRFDYLSTVSGGGYIGAWLSALMSRKASRDRTVTEKDVAAFQARLKTHPEPSESGLPDPANSGFPPVEHAAVRFLRGYSNYLTPRVGLSGDTLAAVSLFLRNFFLLQLALVSLVAAILLSAYVLGALGDLLVSVSKEEAGTVVIWLLYGLGITGLLVALVSSARLLGKSHEKGEPGGAASSVIWAVVFPLTVASLSVVAAFFADAPVMSTEFTLSNVAPWAGYSAAVYILAWIVGSFILPAGYDSDDPTTKSQRGWFFFSAGVAGIVLGLMLWAGADFLTEAKAAEGMKIWHAIAFGPPLFILGTSMVVALHIGAARRGFSEHDREWWARLGGFLILVGGCWLLLFSVVLYAAPLVRWMAAGNLVAFAAWLSGSGIGAWLAKSPDTSDSGDGKPWKETVARLAPWVFVTGLVVVVAYALHLIMLNFVPAQHQWLTAPIWAPVFPDSAVMELQLIPASDAAIALAMAAFIFYLINKVLDINLFSAGALYRNRLTRAFLGASRASRRKPHPFTGFDDEDDLDLGDLEKQRPIPVLGAAVNMTGGDDLAWQTRRAASFAMTPKWVGYQAKSTQGHDFGGYRPTKEYAGGLTLGTAVAISGAAASPNMGYHTSPAVAALLTAFNFRLGYWAGNTDSLGTWMKESPDFAMGPLLNELTGSATAQSNWINLTDGGHFENLGVYELIRRRCRLIVALDAGCDPKYHFEDLSNAVRKCWTDFGVDIQFKNLEPLRPRKKGRFCKSHFAVGTIRYPDGPPGTFIYLKSSLTGDEWPDIREYADKHRQFPHESTVDQFFDEDQFEAYRHLGYDVVKSAVPQLTEAFGVPTTPKEAISVTVFC